jgi:uncharacterized membrane protein
MDVSGTSVALLSLLIGIIAGLRTMTAVAAVSWAARLGWINLAPTGLWFLAHAAAPWLMTLLALTELLTDKLPSTPSRTVPVQFGARLISGGLSGAAIGSANGALLTGLLAGVAGAVIGTFGGRACRAWLARAFGYDRPAALIEDVVAIGGAFLVMAALR